MSNFPFNEFVSLNPKRPGISTAFRRLDGTQPVVVSPRTQIRDQRLKELREVAAALPAGESISVAYVVDRYKVGRPTAKDYLARISQPADEPVQSAAPASTSDQGRA